MWGVWISKVCFLCKALSISNMLPPFFSQIFCHKAQNVPMNVLIKQVEMLGVKTLHDLASFHIKSIPKWAENSGFLISNIWKCAVLYVESHFSAWGIFTINWSFYFSAHIVKHWKRWASNGIAIYHLALSTSLYFIGQKGTGWKCSRGDYLR